jgi:DNA polymerase III subunit gamma/tau
MENNVVLYRKYRPQDFSEIIGQEHIVQTLTNSLKSGSISHAYLLCGPRGSGKTTIARIFAKAVNCQAKTGQKPCNECDSCREIIAAKSLDLVEIDAASHTGVDDIRDLISGIKFAPVKSKYKIFIIDECHQLSKSAVNALLKTLEEPPAHALFMLATTEPHKMIPTIISRCQRFDFKRLQMAEIIKKLEFIAKKEGVKFEPQALALIAFAGRGSFRDAESMLDKCLAFSGDSKTIKATDIEEMLGIVETSHISTLVDFLLAKQAKEAITYLNAMADAGTDMQECAKSLVFYLRQCLLVKINPAFLSPENSGLSPEEIATIKKQADSLTEHRIQQILELFIKAENNMKYASIIQLPLELAIVQIAYE